MSIERADVLIVGLSTRMQEGVRALLSGLPDLGLISSADSTRSALAMYSKVAPALILLDFTLPEGDVRNFLCLVGGQRPKPYCIAIVSNPLQEPAAYRTGADGVLLRGFSRSELLARVRDALSLFAG